MTPSGIGPAARVLAQRECDAIADALECQPDVHAAVHRARKTIRRLRALLALLDNSALTTTTADAALRRLGNGLSALRDAHVVVETCERLAAAQPAQPWKEVCRRLKARREKLLARALAHDPGFARRQAALLRIGTDLLAQPWGLLKAADVRRGLARSERRTANAAKRAARSHDAEDLHRWRRRVRRLRMQLEALPLLAPSRAVPIKGHGRNKNKQARALHALSDQLGGQQDLRMVRNLVRVMPGLSERRALIEQIDADMRDRRVI
ncbi:CHAD domain-containing protein [Stenotrophomonas rhizophila]|uniref:CHAD domain-containing protein n=1 Tax=Stenotrophomonas rhizophila TaxID=216778 RepID=UPI000F4C832D|nr:CHAD domain-containing protein [Stenotrophomonas rhizophila]ROP80556.1 CHAD domain-containing protein [Stenotrophomonas rhizophila]